MSFNVRAGAPLLDGADGWTARRALVVRTIEAFGPDLLGLQEVLAWQGDYLRGALAGYAFVGVDDDVSAGGEVSERVSPSRLWGGMRPRTSDGIPSLGRVGAAGALRRGGGDGGCRS